MDIERERTHIESKFFVRDFGYASELHQLERQEFRDDYVYVLLAYVLADSSL